MSPLKKTDGFELNLTLLAKTLVLSRIQAQIKNFEKPWSIEGQKSVKIKEMGRLQKEANCNIFKQLHHVKMKTEKTEKGEKRGEIYHGFYKETIAVQM
ncbi:MAG: hypothetical protein LBM07_01070 [Culturomica sp.]|nr:hypothetical protein [Culturomica sp.]